MNATTHTDERSIGANDNPDDLDGDLLGRDADGHRHYYHLGRRRVTVRDADGQLVHREALDGRPLSDWLEFVDQEVGGWADLSGHSSHSITEMVEVEDDV